MTIIMTIIRIISKNDNKDDPFILIIIRRKRRRRRRRRRIDYSFLCSSCLHWDLPSSFSFLLFSKYLFFSDSYVSPSSSLSVLACFTYVFAYILYFFFWTTCLNVFCTYILLVILAPVGGSAITFGSKKGGSLSGAASPETPPISPAFGSFNSSNPRGSWLQKKTSTPEAHLYVAAEWRERKRKGRERKKKKEGEKEKEGEKKGKRRERERERERERKERGTHGHISSFCFYILIFLFFILSLVVLVLLLILFLF